MKRYLLFGGDQYYASGGMADYIGDYDDVEEAEMAARALEGKKRPIWSMSSDRDTRVEWWHIFDTKVFEICARSQDGPY